MTFVKTGCCERRWVCTPGRRCRCGGRKGRGAPSARAVGTAARHAHHHRSQRPILTKSYSTQQNIAILRSQWKSLYACEVLYQSRLKYFWAHRKHFKNIVFFRQNSRNCVCHCLYSQQQMCHKCSLLTSGFRFFAKNGFISYLFLSIRDI